MDPQTLERLLIDDALEALTPDVHALLMAHLELIGKQKEQSMWRNVAEAARKVLPDEVRIMPTNLPALRIRPDPTWRRLRTALAAAAVVLIGIAIDLNASHRQAGSRSESNVETATQHPIPSIAVASIAPSIGVTDFWSEKRLLAWATQANKQSKPASKSFWPALQNESRGTR